jgi:hypothetical protein
MITGHSKNRFIGYVQVRVASQVYTLPVEAKPPIAEGDVAPELGFIPGDGKHFSILVDGDAPDKEQRETIERASVDAARHLSRRFLN